MATIKEVANRAGVSITTVSHVINGTRFVSGEASVRVNEAIRELKYRPNNAARNLRSGISKMFGLIVPDNSNPFFAEIARKIENICYENGYNVILCNSDDNLDRERSYVDLLIGKMVDGVIFIATGDQPDNLNSLVQAGIPMVVVDRDININVADVILVDNEQGGYLAAETLINLGHKRLACISGASRVSPSADRVHGFCKALLENNLPVDERMVVSGDLRYDGGITAMQYLLTLPEPPTAVFCCNDLMAVGAMRAIHGAGLHVPEDISLIGFDDIFMASAVTPALTTIAQPIAQIAHKAAELLLARAGHFKLDLEPQRIVFQTSVVERDSCCVLTREAA